MKQNSSFSYLMISLWLIVLASSNWLGAEASFVVSLEPRHGDFASIAQAVQYAQALNTSEPVHIFVDEGRYCEQPVVITNNIILEGRSSRSVVVEPAQPAMPIFSVVGSLDLSGMTIQGATGLGVSAISMQSGELQVSDCIFGNNTNFVSVVGQAGCARAQIEDVHIAGNASFKNAFLLESPYYPAVLLLDRVVWTNSTDQSPDNFLRIAGAQSDCFVNSLSVCDRVAGSIHAIEASDGSLVTVENSLFQNCSSGLYVPVSEQAPSIIARRCVGVGNTYDALVEDAECTGILQTCFDQQRISLAGGKVFLTFDEQPFNEQLRTYTLPAADLKTTIDTVAAATDQNTASTLVKRDASGNFSAGTITAAVTGAASANVLKSGDTMTGNLVLDNQKQLQLRETTLEGTDYVAMQAPAALAASYTLTMPTTAGTDGYALTTNGLGVLGWTPIASAANTVLQGGNSFGAAMTIGSNDEYDLNLEANGTTRLTISTAGVVSTTGALTAGGALTVSSGGAGITGNSSVTGTLGVSSDFAVATNKFTVAAATGNTAVAGTLGVASDFKVNTDKFSVTAASGNTAVAGTLSSGGALTVSSGGAGITGNSSVTGTLGVSSDFAVATNKFTVAADTGNTAVAGTLGVTSDLKVNTDKFSVTAASGNTAVAGTLSSGGALTVSSGGAGITGNSSVTGTLGVSSDFAVATNKFTVAADTGNTAVAGTLTAAGAVSLTNQQQLRLLETTLEGTDYVAMQAPAALAASYTLTMPTTAGTEGYALTTNGLGVLGWTPIASAANTVLQGGNSFGAAMTIGSNDEYDLNLETNGTTRVTVSSAGVVSTTGALTAGGALTVSSGGAGITGNSSVTGTLGVSSDFAVATNKFTVVAATGNTAVAGTLGVASDLKVNTDKFSVTAASGNTAVAGTLSAGGALTVSSGGAGITGNSSVTGTLGVSSDFAVATNKFTVAADTGNTVVAGTLGITSDLKVNTDKFSVTAASGNTAVAGTLSSGGALTVSSGGADITGNLDLDNSTSSTGVITKNGGTRFLHNYGTDNTFLGASSGNLTLTGTKNAGVGVDTLTALTSGGSNVALGYQAGNQITTGTSNVLLGYQAGTNYTSSETNNICIGNTGSLAESNTIRLGNASATSCYVTGIFGQTVDSESALALVMDSTHKIGTVVSSQRFKENIRSIGSDSERFAKLRPVKYTMRHDQKHTPMYGLIAEEIYSVYPELVVLDEQGKPLAIKEHLLPGIIINEVQAVERKVDYINDLLEQTEIEGATRVPAIKVHAFALRDQVVPASGDLRLVFDVVTFDTNHVWNLQKQCFVAPRSGVYSITVGLSMDVRNLARRSLVILKNGMPIPGYGVCSQGLSMLPGFTQMVELAAGDGVEFLYSGKGGDTFIGGFTSLDIRSV